VVSTASPKRVRRRSSTSTSRVSARRWSTRTARTAPSRRVGFSARGRARPCQRGARALPARASSARSARAPTDAAPTRTRRTGPSSCNPNPGTVRTPGRWCSPLTGLAGGTPGGRAGPVSGSGSWGAQRLERWLAASEGPGPHLHGRGRARGGAFLLAPLPSRRRRQCRPRRLWRHRRRPRGAAARRIRPRICASERRLGGRSHRHAGGDHTVTDARNPLGHKHFRVCG
jgi:hypothetical protein